MEFRTLGKSTLKVSPLCFGGNVFGWTINEEESFRILDAFVDSGFNFIDTANSYSKWVPGNKGGESEMVIGNWLKKSGKRHRIVLATKVGSEMAPGEKGLSKNYIKKAVEASLQRLQTDYIDLYQSHYDDLSLPVTEPLEAYQDLIREGKVRVIGASNFDAGRLKEALEASANGLPRYESLQPHYNLVEREEFEKDLEAVCEHYSLGVISYFSLASGFLSGKYRSEQDLARSARGHGVKKYLNEHGFRVLSALDDVSKKHNATLAQTSLAWLIARPSVTAPIVSATSVQQWNDLARAAELQLDLEDIQLLNAASTWLKAEPGS